MDIFKNAVKASLLLEDGEILSGYSVGSKAEVIGNLTFNTGVVGFQEILTDPANSGSLVVQTFPLTGNYGVNADSNLSDSGAKGWIIREWCDSPSNFRCEERIDTFLEKRNITGIFDLDTRALTRKIRTNGSCNGLITTEALTTQKEAELLSKLLEYKVPAPAWKQNKEVKTYGQGGKIKLTLVDYGVRNDIIAALTARGCQVTVVPSSYTERQIRETNPQGIVLCGGGDCHGLEEERETVDLLMKLHFPIMGIDFGHLLMALCCGATIEKMHCGHRGANCPVTELATGRTFITSQNHGSIVRDFHTTKAKQSYQNANDKTCEGLDYLECKGFSVQFIPEAEIGRKNFDGIYDKFFGLIG